MKLPGRRKQSRLLRRDWAGDGILTLVAGAVLVVAVFLPWANVEGPGDVNFSLSQSNDIVGVLRTQWGVPALLLALAVAALGVAMTLSRPRRFSWTIGVTVAACGVAVFAVAQDAAAHTGFYDPGVGMYLTTLVAVLLVPIGLAAALVALVLARAGRGSADPPAPTPSAPTAPPAPESAPPS